MKDRMVPTRNRSIRLTLLSLLVAIVILTVAVMVVVIVMTTQSQGKNAQRVGQEVIVNQAQDFLLQITMSSAREHSEVLQRAADEVQKLSGYLGAVYDHSDHLQTSLFDSSQDHLSKGEGGQYMNGPESVSSVFIPYHKNLDDGTARDVALGAYLDLLFPSVFENIPNVEAIYFATPGEVTRYFPNIQLGEIVPPDFRVTERIWFVISRPENNPLRETRWTNLYVDAAGSGLVTTVASPVYDGSGNFVGVIGLDLTLNALVNRIEETQLLKGGYSFLINEVGHAIALPDQGYRHILGREQAEGEINIDLNRSPNGFASMISKMTAGRRGVESIRVGEEDYYVAYVPLENVKWSIGSVIPAEEVLQPVNILSLELEETSRSLLFMRTIPISIMILIAAVILGLFTTNRIVKPLHNLAESARQMTEGHWQIDLPTSDYFEISTLSQSFHSMAADVQRMLQELESGVAARTHALERRSKQIQVAAEVARDAASSRQVNILLDRTVNLLSERFGFIHVGAYLIDEKKAYAVLQAASGEKGKKLIDSRYKVVIGDKGGVGFAASTGRARITPDIEQENQHGLYQILPEIRSELAMPLVFGKKIIGVINVVSDKTNAFDEDDVIVLQIVADQTAVAIDNAHLFEEVQESLQHLQMLYGRYSQEAWQQLEKTSSITGYRYDSAGIAPVDTQEEPNDPTQISIPLTVRGQQIGFLEVWLEEECPDNDKVNLLKAVSERISQAMESARLFEETQERMAREQALNQIIARFSHSLDFDTLLQNAVLEMGQLPNVAEVSIMIDPSKANGPQISI
jgi:GAF domain-containing protein